MRQGHAEEGSVLIEALVAILIVAGMSGLWFETMGKAARQQHEIADRQRALLVARSRLATVGTTLTTTPGTTEGSDTGLAWRIVIAPYPDAGDGLMLVTITVGRDEGRDLATLTSLRLGA